MRESTESKHNIHSHKIFWIFTQGHINDIQSIMVVFLGWKQERKEMKWVGIISL